VCHKVIPTIADPAKIPKANSMKKNLLFSRIYFDFVQLIDRPRMKTSKESGMTQ
jgi:hypothetical protein